MKINKKILSFIMLVILLVNFNYTCWAVQINDEIKITTSENYIGKLRYEDFSIRAKLIKAVETNEIGYCLEIDKNYPSGETFKFIDYATGKLASILSLGYPNKTYQELNVDSEEEAYFATQIAIWSFIEGYDVNGFIGEERILEAIKKIYKDGILNKDTLEDSKKYMIYNFNDKVQNIVFLKNNKDGGTEIDSSIINGK